MHVVTHIIVNDIMKMGWYLLCPMYLFYRFRLVLVHMFLLMLLVMMLLDVLM